jgi:hypothetical protein
VVVINILNEKRENVSQLRSRNGKQEDRIHDNWILERLRREYIFVR